MAKVSVIIPVYNTEKYLEKCLDSVCNQTLSDIEIICIDDCSTDNSLNILKEYAHRDRRIKLIKFEENKGPAVARNLGITEASGEYIAFLDSDDYPEKSDFYERLYNSAIENDADITKGAYKNSDDGYVDETINKKILQDKNNFCSTYCSAIFRHNFIKKNEIKFPELKDMEDPVFAFKCALNANKVEVVPECNLIITKRDNSITSKVPTIEQIKDKIRGLEIICDLANSSSINNSTYVDIISRWFSVVVQDIQVNNTLINNTEPFNYLLSIFNKVKHKDLLKITLEKLYKNLFDYFTVNVKQNLTVDYIKSQIDKVDVVSFDIFDTLLLRPFMKPTDLFLYIQELYDERDFYSERILAEKKARVVKAMRKKEDEDVTIDEIYSKINPKFLKYKNIEIDIETSTLQINRELYDVFCYAKSKNKKIIITSDMYLGSDVLSQILIKNNINGYDNLYVSNQKKATKSSGKLYRLILDDLNIDGRRVLHIGDNYNSDYTQAIKVGLNAIYYKKISTRFFEVPNNIKLKKFYTEKFENLASSIILGMRIIKWQKEISNHNYWYNLGYNYGGILVSEFIKSAIQIAKYRDLSDLFFVARDGYILNKIFKYFCIDKNIKGHYIYASRKLRSLCLNNEEHYNVDTDLNYKEYINKLKLNGNRIGVLDSCALISYSAQNLIKKYLNEKYLLGIYLVASVNYKLEYINLTNSNIEEILKDFNWDIIELFMSSPENPIVDFQEKKPVFQKSNDYETARHKILVDILQGEEDFAKDYTNIFGQSSYCIKMADIFSYMGNYWKNLNNTDKMHLYAIKHAQDINSTKYVPLLEQKENVINYIKGENNA